MAGGDDLVTVWLNPDLRPGATEASQPQSLTTRFKANASFRSDSSSPRRWWRRVDIQRNGHRHFVQRLRQCQWFGGRRGNTVYVSFVAAGAGIAGELRARSGQTRDGYIWVGTDDGVSRFDGVNFFSLGPQEGFQGGPVQVLFGDSRGALWIGSVGAV